MPEEGQGETQVKPGPPESDTARSAAAYTACSAGRRQVVIVLAREHIATEVRAQCMIVGESAGKGC